MKVGNEKEQFCLLYMFVISIKFSKCFKITWNKNHLSSNINLCSIHVLLYHAHIHLFDSEMSKVVIICTVVWYGDKKGCQYIHCCLIWSWERFSLYTLLFVMEMRKVVIMYTVLYGDEKGFHYIHCCLLWRWERLSLICDTFFRSVRRGSLLQLLLVLPLSRWPSVSLARSNDLPLTPLTLHKSNRPSNRDPHAPTASSRKVWTPYQVRETFCVTDNVSMFRTLFWFHITCLLFSRVLSGTISKQCYNFYFNISVLF
jgi:hypothetical protein